MAELSTYSATIAPIPASEPSPVVVEPGGNLNTPSPEPPSNDPAPPAPDPVVETEDDVVEFKFDENAPEPPKDPTPSNPTPPSQPSFNLDEEIKKADRTELLKKLGVSEFAIEMDTHIARGGQPVDYLNAKAINYDNISDEELVKQDLKKSYPNFTPQEIDRMYNRKYGVNDTSMSEEEIQDATLELKAKGYEIRQHLKTEQQKFKIAEVANSSQNNEAYTQWKQTQEENTRLVNQLNEFYNGHTATKALNESKRVTINFGEGVKPLNFNIDKPDLITTAMLDGGLTIAQRSLNEKGEPDVARQQLGAFLALDPYKAVQTIFNYGKSVGERGKVAEGQNATRTTTSAGGTPTADEKPKYSTGTYGGGATK